MLLRKRKQEFGQKKHIDFDDIEQTFYENIYFEEINFVLKVPLIGKNSEDIKIEKFDLSKYKYLVAHD